MSDKNGNGSGLSNESSNDKPLFFKVEADKLREDLDHTIEHLEIATKECGPIVPSRMNYDVDTLARRITKLVFDFNNSTDADAYVTCVRLGAIFNSLRTITTLLCAAEVGGEAGKAAKKLVMAALMGD